MGYSSSVFKTSRCAQLIQPVARTIFHEVPIALWLSTGANIFLFFTFDYLTERVLCTFPGCLPEVRFHCFRSFEVCSVRVDEFSLCLWVPAHSQVFRFCACRNTLLGLNLSSKDERSRQLHFLVSPHSFMIRK